MKVARDIGECNENVINPFFAESLNFFGEIWTKNGLVDKSPSAIKSNRGQKKPW